ncbi:MAG: hypothetical protein ACHQEM_12745, partial [Chitinophagales bacterium]
MKKYLFLAICFSWPLIGSAQPKLERLYPNPVGQFINDELFAEDDLLNLELNGNIRAVNDDRGDVPSFHPLTLIYRDKANNLISFPVEVKARGHFRKLRENCIYPPLLIAFPKKDSTQSTVFADQLKLKLVMP